MTMILNKKYIWKGSYKLFIENRILRLYPIYLVVLLLWLIVSVTWWLLVNNWGYFNNYISYGHVLSFKSILLLSFSNLFIIWQDIIRLFTFDTTQGDFIFFGTYSSTFIWTSVFLFLPQAWSLSIELFFYSIAPFIVRRKTELILWLVVVILIVRRFLFFFFYKDNSVNLTYFFPYQLVLFLFWSLGYKISNFLRHDKIIQKNWNIIIGFFFLLIFLGDILEKYLFSINTLSWMIYLLAIVVIPLLFIKTESNLFDRKLWELSYPIYIVHILIAYIVIAINDKTLYLSHIFVFFITVVFSVSLSLLLLKYVDNPINNVRQNKVLKFFWVNKKVI